MPGFMPEQKPIDPTTAKYDAAEQRLLRYLDEEYPNFLEYGRTHEYTETNKSVLMEDCQLDESTYQRIAKRFAGLGIVERVYLGQPHEWLKIKPIISQIVLNLDDPPPKDLIAETKATLHSKRWYLWLWVF